MTSPAPVSDSIGSILLDAARDLERAERELLEPLKAEQARNLWRSIEAVVTAGGSVTLAPSGVVAVMPSGAVFSEQREKVADAAAQVLNRIVCELDEAEAERPELRERLDAETRVPVLDHERDARSG